MRRLKRSLYFPIATYFAFFARLALLRWQPKIIVVTGSTGKTTLLHLLEAQLGSDARYSHHANSSYGIPFDILGLKRKTFTHKEWLSLFLLAPLCIFQRFPKEHLYIVETDCDRPHEGDFLSRLLQPDIVLWLNTSRTHSANFDALVHTRRFATIDEAIASEFGFFLERCRELAIVNGDSVEITKQLSRTTVPIQKISTAQLNGYTLQRTATEFVIDGTSYSLPFLLPKEVFSSVAMCVALLTHLQKPIDRSFVRLQLPPGRNALFSGIRKTTLIDSSYNATLASMVAMVQLFEELDAEHKWAVIGDMIEQGEEEANEHSQLAQLLLHMHFERIILVGPRVEKYVYPILAEHTHPYTTIEHFLEPKDVLTYLQEDLHDGETILFKGARFLEGVIEHLLANPNDKEKLCRREKKWQLRRAQWGL